MSDDFSEDDLQGQSTLEDLSGDREEASQRYTVDLPRSLHRKMKYQALEEDRSMREITIESLEDYLRKNG